MIFLYLHLIYLRNLGYHFLDSSFPNSSIPTCNGLESSVIFGQTTNFVLHKDFIIFTSFKKKKNVLSICVCVCEKIPLASTSNTLTLNRVALLSDLETPATSPPCLISSYSLPSTHNMNSLIKFLMENGPSISLCSSSLNLSSVIFELLWISIGDF